MHSGSGNARKNCLILSVTVVKKQAFVGSDVKTTNPRDYLLAEGEGEVAKYLGSSDGVESAVRDMDTETFTRIFKKERHQISIDGLPVDTEDLKFKTFLKGSMELGVYSQLFYCDLGPGGGMTHSYASSQRYKLKL